MATVHPAADTAFHSPINTEAYREMAADPMNRWLVQFVRDHGIRDALGVQPGVAFCADHLVVDPAREPHSVVVPAWAGAPEKLRNVLTGETLAPAERTPAGPRFELPGATAYEPA